MNATLKADLGIALELAGQLGAVLPVSALAAQLETGLIAVLTIAYGVPSSVESATRPS